MENPCPHGFRIEHDLLGEREIPSEAYWGIHTLRAQENFPLSKQPVHPELIKALAAVKQACALTHLKLGALPEDIGNAIVQAAAEVASGALADQFPVDALQGGAGTSANMNVNEVIANRALEILESPKALTTTYTQTTMSTLANPLTMYTPPPSESRRCACFNQPSTRNRDSKAPSKKKKPNSQGS